MRVQDIDTGLQELERELFSAMMDPEPARPDWAERRPRIITMCDKALTLFAALERAQSLLGAKERETWTRRAARDANQLVALLHAAGETEARATLLRAGLRVAMVGPPQDELEAARRSPALHLALARARWLRARKRHAEARVQLDKVLAGDEAILVDAAELVEAVEPPPLKTWRGCGHGLFGHHDERPDRSYLTTRCFQLFGLPVWPRSRYRVRKTREGLFFMGQLPISTGARWARRLSVAGVVALAAAVGLWFWLQRTSRQLEQALAAAARVERRGPPEAAARRYLDVAARFRKRVSGRGLAPVATALVRIELARKRPPGSPSALAGLELLVARLGTLPPEAARSGAGASLAKHLEQVAGVLEAQGAASADDAVGLLEHAASLATAGDSTRLGLHRDQLRRTSAEALATEWPLLAIERFGALGDDAHARTRQGELLVQVAATPGLLGEVEVAARDFLRWAGPRSELADAVRKLERALEAAGVQAMDAARNRALESRDAATLTELLRRTPTDQAALALLASIQTGADAAASWARLEKLGRPGWLDRRARVALALRSLASGDLARADDLLGHELAFRLPHYRAAQRAYLTAHEALLAQLLLRVKRHQLPAELRQSVEGKPRSVALRLLTEWVERSLASDPELTQLREHGRDEAVAIDLALRLGTLQLERARLAPEAERAALQAAAERSFLAVMGEVSAGPRYRAGLGQAYYRLGRSDDARRELDGLLEGADLEQTMMAAEVHGSVGMVARARALVETVAQGPEPERTLGLVQLAMLASTMDEAVAVLSRADPEHPAVKQVRRLIEAERALEAGQLVDADAQFAALIADARAQPASDERRNDEASALEARCAATGKLELLDEAIAIAEHARERTPNSRGLLHNLVNLLEHRAHLGVLAEHLALGRLRLRMNTGDPETIIDALLAGPQGGEFRAALARAPATRRAAGLFRLLQAMARYSPRSYTLELGLAVRLHDVDALTALADRVRGRELDSSSADRRRDGQQRGQEDKWATDEARATLTLLESALGERAAATAATAHLLSADRLRTLALVEVAPAQARDAVSHLRAAARGWSALGLERTLANALLLEAVLELAASDPAIHAMVRRDRYEFTSIELVAHLPDGARKALALRPQAVEALALVRRAATRAPEDADLVLARALGDGALEQLARPALDDALQARRRELGVLLDPRSPAAIERAALKP